MTAETQPPASFVAEKNPMANNFTSSPIPAETPPQDKDAKHMVVDEEDVPTKDGPNNNKNVVAPAKKNMPAFGIKPKEHPPVGNTAEFNLRPVVEGEVFQCLLRREKGFMSKPTYHLFTPDGAQFLMSARARSGVATANYLISTTKNEIKKESTNIIGKVRARDGQPYKSHEYMVYTTGENPANCEQYEKVRQELAFVQFQGGRQFKDKNAPQMNICVPCVMPNGRLYDIRPMTDEHDDPTSLQNLVDREGLHEITTLKTHKPAPLANGKRAEASVKNFTVGNEAFPGSLQYAKVGKDEYIMEFKYPLSPCQAFGICLTIMDNNGCTENYGGGNGPAAAPSWWPGSK